MSKSYDLQSEVTEKILEIDDIKTLKELNHIVVERIRELQRREGSDIKLSLIFGTKVKIKENTTRKGDRLLGVVGKVIKLNPTKAQVDFDGKIWNVPYSMLEKV